MSAGEAQNIADLDWYRGKVVFLELCNETVRGEVICCGRIFVALCISEPGDPMRVRLVSLRHLVGVSFPDAAEHVGEKVRAFVRAAAGDLEAPPALVIGRLLKVTPFGLVIDAPGGVSVFGYGQIDAIVREEQKQ